MKNCDRKIKLLPINLTLEERRAFNNQIRHLTIVHLYKAILEDMTVCEIEDWDKTEFIKQLQAVINHFKVRK